MRPLARAAAIATLLALAPAPAGAWSNHTLDTREALLPLAALDAPVKAEPLEAFLAAEAEALGPLLDEEDRWAAARLPDFPRRPAALAFRPGGEARALRARFLHALRVNPEAGLGLFVQLPPGREPAERLPPGAVTLLPGGAEVARAAFRALRPGEELAAREVVATAADEPDYGLDLGLFEDNGTTWGRAYGFGRQPFGNPALPFGSQAPFHMAFSCESRLVYAAAGFLRRTYPEHRIHQYLSLSAHAFRTGHTYWGWRFAGWALHYLQDLAQPYHARVLPGVGVARMLGIAALDKLGFHGPQARAVTLVSNRHLALETLQVRLLLEGLAGGRHDAPLVGALRDVRQDAEVRYGDATPREVVARGACQDADALDEALVAALPDRYTADPAYVYDDARDATDLLALARRAPPEAHVRLLRLLERRMDELGRASRALLRSLPAPGVAR